MPFSATSASSVRHGGTLPMDLESIRARRVKLQSILRAKRPPPLTGVPAELNSGGGSLLPRPTPLLRSTYSSHSSSSIDSSSKTLTPTVSTLRPFPQRLPDIGKSTSSSTQTSTSEDSRQTDRRRRTRRRNHRLELTEEEEEEDDLEDAECTQEAVEDIVRGIGSNSRKRRLYSTVQARKMLSQYPSPIQKFLKAGVLRPLIPHVQQRQDTTLQVEAMWVLTNLASGNTKQTAAVVDAGAVPVVVAALADGDEKVKEQAAWVLGNIAGEERYRNQVVSAGVISPLLGALRSGRDSAASISSASSSTYISAPASLVRVVAWVLGNIFRYRDLVISAEQRRACVTALKTLLAHADTAVVVDALWMASHITAEDEAGRREVVAAGLVPDLVRFLGDRERSKVCPALRATGNLVMGDDNQTDAVVAAGVLPLYGRLLQSRHHNLRKETAWALSNVMAGSRWHIQRVIDEGILPHLVLVVEQDFLDVQREATWALSNLTNGGGTKELEALLAEDGAAALTKVLAVSETGTVEAALRALHSLLKTPELRKEAVTQVEEADGVRLLESLQGFVDIGIRAQATEILETILREESSDNDTDEEADGGADKSAGGNADKGADGDADDEADSVPDDS